MSIETDDLRLWAQYFQSIDSYKYLAVNSVDTAEDYDRVYTVLMEKL